MLHAPRLDNERTPIPCQQCPIGFAAGEGHGGRCPMVGKSHRAGTWIYTQGESAEGLWFVKHGTVVLRRDSSSDGGLGTARVIRREGSLIGAEALVQGTYTDSARAVTDVVLCRASKASIRAWMENTSGAPMALLNLTIRAQAEESPVDHREDATARVARWVLREAALNDTPRVLVADLLGMLPETLSRTLAMLMKRGLIETTRQSVRVLDAEGLAALCTPRSAREPAAANAG